jgi:hypothetical protein
MTAVALIPFALALAFAQPQASIEDRTVPFDCNDTVVIGTVESHSIDPVESKEDIIGHGWVAATLKLKAIVKGPHVPHVLPVKYFAHTYMRHGRDFMLVLHQTDQDWVIRNGQLMSVLPVVADHCR